MLMMSLYPLLQVHRGANWPRRAGGVLLVSGVDGFLVVSGRPTRGLPMVCL